MPQIDVVIACPKCNNQQTKTLNTAASQPAQCHTWNGGCGAVYTVYVDMNGKVGSVKL